MATCRLMLKGIEFLERCARASHTATLSEFSQFCSTLTFHREIRRLPSVLYPGDQGSPKKLTLIQSPGNGYVCMCVCVFVSLHHWCGHRAKVQSEMCGPGSGGAMASVNGEAKVSTSALTLSFFSRLLCH